MVTRLLDATEWPKLLPLWEESFPGEKMPTPLTHRVGVFEEDGEIKAALFFGLVVHMEPFMAKKGYGKLNRTLLKLIENSVESEFRPLTYYTFMPKKLVLAADFKGDHEGFTVMRNYVPVKKEIK